MERILLAVDGSEHAQRAARVAGDRPDPVPHAMVLTGIVVAVSATALALALACRIHQETGNARITENEPE